ncbi:MAG: sodium:solute symporter family protein [bacterium]|nr:sodium:solute symporter family protein [bacterium]
MEIGLLDKSILFIYFAFMIGIGLVLAGRTRSFDQFLIAGRSLSAPLLVCTLVSTYYGLGVLLAGSEISYEAGVVNWFFDTAPAYVFILLTAFFLSQKIRRRDVRSIPDIIETHYGLTARVITAAAGFIYALPAFSIMGMGGLFYLLFGIPFEWGLLLGSAVALVYTALGGLLAVALTDAVQFVLMSVTLALAALIGLPLVGDIPQMQHLLPDHFLPTGNRPVALLFVYGLTALSILVEPAFYQRIFAAASRRAVVLAMSAGVLIWMSYDWIITMLGIAAHAAVLQGIMVAPGSPDQAVSQFVMHVLPVGLKGLFAAGLMAAAMSTMDSYLLISASSLVYDIWRPLFGKNMDDRALLRWTRLMLVASTTANIGVCLYFRNVERLWIFMTAILICTTLVPVLAAFYWPRVKRAAGLVTSVTGLALVLLYYAWVDLLGTWNEEEAAYIWTGSLFSIPVELNQDYGILYILPLVVLTFLIVQLSPWGRSQ